MEQGHHFVSGLDPQPRSSPKAPRKPGFQPEPVGFSPTGGNRGVISRDLSPGWAVGSSPSHLTCCPPSSAGVTMKLMDEVAGIVAARHCKTNIVTASVDAINFHDKIRKGNTTPPTERGCLGYLGLCTVCFWFTLAPPGAGLCPFARETEARGLYPAVMLFRL